MTTRKVKLKETSPAKPCPKCGNTLEFVVTSEQVAEDCCEVWAACICGHRPGKEGFEDVWGGVDDENCLAAIEWTWNDEL